MSGKSSKYTFQNLYKTYAVYNQLVHILYDIMPPMKRFTLKRIEDESGVSGTGIVAEGVMFSNGKCALAWITKYQSIAVYESIEELENIHGHNGKTVIVWMDL